jgi:non-canonical (house-cleaning) NTP pyrophosphatase
MCIIEEKNVHTLEQFDKIDSKTKVIIASTSQCKVDAIVNIFLHVEKSKEEESEKIDFFVCSPNSGVKTQPFGHEETHSGSFNRCSHCVEHIYSQKGTSGKIFLFGVESGLVKIENKKDQMIFHHDNDSFKNVDLVQFERDLIFANSKSFQLKCELSILESLLEKMEHDSDSDSSESEEKHDYDYYEIVIVNCVAKQGDNIYSFSSSQFANDLSFAIKIPQKYHIFVEESKKLEWNVTFGELVEKEYGWGKNTWHKHIGGITRTQQIEKVIIELLNRNKF